MSEALNTDAGISGLREGAHVDLFLPAEVLKLQTSLLKSVFETLDDGVAISDEKGELIYFNPSGIRILGINVLHGGPNTWTKTYGVYLPDTVTPFPAERYPLARATKGEHVTDTEMFVKNTERPEGMFLSVAAKPMYDATGHVVGGLAIFRDITEKKKQAEALRLSEAKFRLAFEESPHGLAMVGGDLKFLRVNSALSEMLGYSSEELIKLSVPDVTHPDDYVLTFNQLKKFMSENQKRVTFEKRYLTKSGSPVCTRVRVNFICDAEEKFQFFLTMIEDITTQKQEAADRERAEEKLRLHAEELARSNAELEQFAYVASHDLKEPLRMVSTFSKLLTQRYQGQLDQNANEYLEFIMDATLRMHGLIDALLEYSRVGRGNLDQESLPLTRIFENVSKTLQTTFQETGATITLGKLPHVFANETLLTQLVQNLLSNSLKFRGRGRPKIEVQAQQKGKEWIFSFRDNGIGIEPRFHERVFKLFHRLHTRDEYPGSGVGLAVCKKIVESLRGKIWVESELGRGTTFYFSLPASRCVLID